MRKLQMGGHEVQETSLDPISNPTVEYTAIVEVAPDRFIVWFPDLPGIVVSLSRVDQIADAATNALILRLIWLDQHNKRIPVPRSREQVLDDPVVKLAMADCQDFAVQVSAQIELTSAHRVQPTTSGDDGQRRRFVLH